MTEATNASRAAETAHSPAEDVVGPRSERDLRRFEAYCRWSIHILLLAAGFVLVLSGLVSSQLLDGSPTFASILFAGTTTFVSVGWTALAIVVTEFVCRENAVPRPIVWTFAAFSVAVTFGFAALLPPDAVRTEGAGAYMGLGPVGLAGTASVASLTKQWRRVAAGIAVAAPILVLVYVVGPPRAFLGMAVAITVLAVWFCVFCIPAALATRWMIDVVRRLWRSRQVAADLAVAEERLRFSRDLHDVFGRTLSTVAVKSELAAELVRRGDDRAADEMMAVRELAQTALTDVRGLVRGYRRIELGEEIAGARSVLHAAGFRMHADGVDDLDAVTRRITDAAAEALAWVVREGSTNVLRHGHGGGVRLEIRETPDQVEVTIENNAARAGESSPGSGLVGLRERLEAVGGALRAGPSGSRFVLTATVPTASAQRAVPSPAIDD